MVVPTLKYSSDEGYHIGIVGLGLMGGSLARRLTQSGITVTAWNHRATPYAAARQEGIVCVDSLQELANCEPDIIVLCNPLAVMPQMFDMLAAIISPHATITDIGSVKEQVKLQAGQAGLSHCYVGAHPMAGTECSGFAASNPSLYDHALWAVCADTDTDQARCLQIIDLVTNVLRNRCIVLDPVSHDRSAALISHMPHVVSVSLLNMLVDRDDRAVAQLLSAGSWRDMTRVARTDPDRTRAMVEEDRDNVVALLRDLSKDLTAIADALHDSDESAIASFFTHANELRSIDQQVRLEHMAISHNNVHQGLDVLSSSTQETQRVTLDPVNWRAQLQDLAHKGRCIVHCDVQTHELTVR